MPIDDSLYQSELDTAYDELVEAVDEASAWMLDPENIFGEEKSGPAYLDGFYHTMECVRTYFELFYNLGRLSTGTQELIEGLEKVDSQLSNLVWSEVNGPTEIVKDKLSDWKGDTASTFKNGYLTGLAKSIHGLYESMAALKESGKIYEAIIDQTRERYMNMLDNTIQAIEESTRRRERASSSGLVIKSVAAGALGVIALPTGGGKALLIAGVMLAAAGTAGEIIENEEKADQYSIVGENFSEILVDFVNKCSDLEAHLKEEINKVERSLDRIAQEFNDSVNEVLPPYVGLPSDATDDDRADYTAPPAEWDDYVEEGFDQDEIDEFEEGERV